MDNNLLKSLPYLVKPFRMDKTSIVAFIVLFVVVFSIFNFTGEDKVTSESMLFPFKILLLALTPYLVISAIQGVCQFLSSLFLQSIEPGKKTSSIILIIIFAYLLMASFMYINHVQKTRFGINTSVVPEIKKLEQCEDQWSIEYYIENNKAIFRCGYEMYPFYTEHKIDANVINLKLRN